MNIYVLLFLCFSYVLSGYCNGQPPPPLPRVKRDVVGALEILTNHAQPIHADVKSETSDVVEKPCLKSSPSQIEPGVGFQVTAPENAAVTYEIKSLRKSLSTDSPSALEILRSVSRVVTLIVLFSTAVVEFYPSIMYLWKYIYMFIVGK